METVFKYHAREDFPFLSEIRVQGGKFYPNNRSGKKRKEKDRKKEEKSLLSMANRMLKNA